MIEDDHWWVVVSQSCDLTNRSLDKEPLAELVQLIPKAKRRQSPDKRNLWSKNPREIALLNEDGLVLNGSISNRVFITRERLQGLSPSVKRVLAPRHRQALRKWLAGRYVRPAFPGGFNDRIQPGEESIEALLTEHEPFLRGLYCRVRPTDEALPADQPYVSQWILVYRQAILIADDDRSLEILEEEAEERALAIATALQGILTTAPITGIQTQVEVKPDDRFSLVDLDAFDLWDKEFISFQTDSGLLLPPGIEAGS